MTRDLEKAIRDIRSRQPRAPSHAADDVSPADAAFRAAVDERLRGLERQVDEIKSRVNGLLFLLAGAVATQVVLRVFA